MRPRSTSLLFKRWPQCAPAHRAVLVRLLLAALPFTIAAQPPVSTLSANAGVIWSSLSNARGMRAIRDVDGEQLLTRLRDLPVRSWQSALQPASVRHVGPTAQDFRAAFGVGDSDSTITPVDAAGVSLAAARALEIRTRALRAENAVLREELRALRTSSAATRRDLAALWSELAALRRQDAARPPVEFSVNPTSSRDLRDTLARRARSAHSTPRRGAIGAHMLDQRSSAR